MLLAIIRVDGAPPGSEGPFGWILSLALCVIVFLISFLPSRGPQRLHEGHLAVTDCSPETAGVLLSENPAGADFYWYPEHFYSFPFIFLDERMLGIISKASEGRTAFICRCGG